MGDPFILDLSCPKSRLDPFLTLSKFLGPPLSKQKASLSVGNWQWGYLYSMSFL